MDKALNYIFVLSVLLILAVYYIGVSTDAATVSAGVNNLVKTATGRNSAGNFAAYPA